ncbi:MAG: oligosaccharide flippase family protein, partial [Acidobacteriota bacterium]|nr:oligosaccharide flippase family protein [Acidobacteriota bacterium]
LYESIAAVLLPRMSQLQMQGKRREMIELAARASEKLALVYFPVYAYFLVVAEDLITTLFTKTYLESVPIFLINITLLLFYVWITDPIVRAFEHLGRFILKVRLFIVICLFATLWFGINYFDLRGMIAIVVAMAIVERIITAYKAWQTIGASWNDVVLLKNVGKIAFTAFIAGVVTFLFRWEFRQSVSSAANLITENFALALKQSLSETLAGVIVLASSGILFAIVYMILANYFELISDDEKRFVKKFFSNLTKPFKKTQTAQWLTF